MPFDLEIDNLKKKLASVGDLYSPAEVRKIVLTILVGQNYRTSIETATSLEISCYMSWVLSVCHKAKLEFGNDWLSKLQGVCVDSTGVEADWLGVWLMGLTIKTQQNLGVKAKRADYLKQVKVANDKLVRQYANTTSIELYSKGLAPMKLSTGDSIWLLQIAGAAVLTVRGSKKSSVGKLLEKAIARACFTALGLVENHDFKINLAADKEVERETDAEIKTRRGTVRVDVALIGTGNQEVSEDKLSRVGRHGIVIVDKLGARSKVPGNADKAGVHLTVIQGHKPLSDLYNHLEPLMPENKKLTKPPTEHDALQELLDNLPDRIFVVAKPMLHAEVTHDTKPLKGMRRK